MPHPQFPRGFLFGTATAAFQVEGSPYADGKKASIWDTFSHKKGKIRTGENADTACDTYLDPERDIDLMVALRMNAYRFSVAWSRVMPDGRGGVNQKGLDYYSRLVDLLLERGITPFVTLYHWDMPQALEDALGGFANRETCTLFAEYATVVVKALGDRVKDWITLNEPWEHAALGHLLGDHAPGKRNPWTYMKVAHHELLAHGMGLQAIRAVSPDARVGITLSQTPILPVTDKPADIKAAALGDQFFNDFFLDGIYKGIYPEPLWSRTRLIRPHIGANDMRIISGKTDFLGLNYYSREYARAAWYVPFLGAWVDEVDTSSGERVVNGYQFTNFNREVYPRAFYERLMYIKERCSNPPVYITENGASFTDKLEDGRVHDPLRVAFLEGYMNEAANAARDGVDLRGYFIWTMMDNFEWREGYAKRFGLVYVDHATQERVIKDSGYWVRDMIRNQKARSK